jgi:hypothetical protein
MPSSAPDTWVLRLSAILFPSEGNQYADQRDNRRKDKQATSEANNHHEDKESNYGQKKPDCNLKSIVTHD